MMKRLLMLVVLVMALIPVELMADDYSNMWKKFEQAQKNDLPQTQIKVLSSIVKKATRDKRYGQLLKAQLLRTSVATQISADSLDVEVERLKAEAERALDVDTVLAAVYENVLGRLYRDNAALGESHEKMSAEHFARSLQRPDLLAAAKSEGYVPVVVQGADSKIFGGDLLHVLGMEAKAWDVLGAWYESHGNRAAACYCQLRHLESKDEIRIDDLDALISRYGDLPVCGEVAITKYQQMGNAPKAEKIRFVDDAVRRWGEGWPRMKELTMARRELCRPSYKARLGEGVSMPDRPRKVKLEDVVNMRSLTMTVQRVDVDGTCEWDPNDAKDYEKLRAKLDAKGPVQKETLNFEGHDEWEVLTDSLTIKGLPLGVYLVEFSGVAGEVGDAKDKMLPRRSLIHVSNLYVIEQELPGKRIRYVVVDAAEGMPVANARLQLRSHKYTGDRKDIKTVLTTDGQGEAIHTYTQRQPDFIYVSYANDKAYPERRGDVYYYTDEREGTRPYVSIFTDRRIYRPGQTVKAKVLVWQTLDHVDSKVQAGVTVTVKLRDANQKVVEAKEMKTDEFGGAEVDFVLPKSGLTGQFSLFTDYGSAEFWVEEYKRPSFKVDFEAVATEYKAGDTLAVSGAAKSFAGVPVQGAKVKFKVTRRPAIWWWWRRSVEQDKEILRGETMTNDDGTFKVDVPLLMEKAAATSQEGMPRERGRYYVFNVEADVMDMAGETHHGETYIPLSNKPVAFRVDIDDESVLHSADDALLLFAEKKHNMKFAYLNNAGKALAAKVDYYIDDERRKQTVDANTTAELDLSKLKSGRHRLVATCGGERLEQDFTVFSINDKRPVMPTHDWFFATGEEFPRDGGAVKVQFGSSDEHQHVVYSVVSGKKLLESGKLDQSNALTTREFAYKEEYGEGILFTCAWVKDGQLYSHSQRIVKPLPEKRLKVEWSVFRDRLTPGQKEEWELKVSDASGKPVKAQVVAGMFDRSLDEIRTHFWYFALGLWRSLPSTEWTGGYFDSFHLYSSMNLRHLPVPALDFSRFDDVAFGIMPHDEMMVFMRGPMQATRANMVGAIVGTSLAADKVVMAKNAAGEVKKESASTNAHVEMREDLTETAFFYPNLMTDEDGHVKIGFTLPESVTTWRFMGFVHDKETRHGGIESEIVAQKQLMVQPNMPRFLRKGDEGRINVKVFNTSEQALGGVSTIELIEPETERMVYTQEQPFGVEAGKTCVVGFDVDAANLPSLLICRVKASANGFSDGEQHYLAMLPDEEMVTTTIPFTQNEAGVKTIDLKGLFPSTVKDAEGDLPKLTIEYTNNPAWLMVQALSAVAKPNSENAISLASAIYANSISASLLQQSPQIESTIKLWKQESGEEGSMMSALQKDQDLKLMVLEETPWVMEAEHEANQKQRLLELFDDNQLQYKQDDFMKKLKALQNSDGSFSWWPGMPGSPWTTISVAETLVRLNHMIGEQPRLAPIVRDALGYLDKEMHAHVLEMKKWQRKGEKKLLPSEWDVSYLYIRSLNREGLTATSRSDIDYLVGLLAKRPTALTIYGKAVSAIIMAKNNRPVQAKNLLQSLREYTVYTEEMGRYFDTRHAYYSWFDYKIPTEVAAIEAIKLLQPDDKQTVAEMQRWLLQEKRTQSWSTPINAVNAVYAFMNGETNKLSASGREPSVMKVDGRQVETPSPTAGLGYVKTSLRGAHHQTFTIEKTSEGTSWGALYAQYMQKATDVAASSSGFSVKREVLVEDAAGKWQHAQKGRVALKVGDKVRVRLTIKADRDYDFVQLLDKRAACLEPAVQLSGYRGGYYCAPHDNATHYYFDQMAKGTHVVETEYFVDREGTYQSGTCTVQCAYSPEYMGKASGETFVVE